MTGVLEGAIGGGEEPTGRGFIGGGNQHPNPLDLHLRVLSAGIICRHRCAQAVTAQQADDQLRLGAAGNDRHRLCRAVHDRNSSAPVPACRPRLYRYLDARALGPSPDRYESTWQVPGELLCAFAEAAAVVLGTLSLRPTAPLDGTQIPGGREGPRSLAITGSEVLGVVPLAVTDALLDEFRRLADRHERGVMVEQVMELLATS